MSQEQERREAEIRERAAKASPGPWELRIDGHKANRLVAGDGIPIASHLAHAGLHRVNSEFIAHSREDVPWLLSQLQEDQRHIISLYAQVDSARAYADEMAEITQYHKKDLEAERAQTAKLRDCLAEFVGAAESGQNRLAIETETGWYKRARTLLAAGEEGGAEGDDLSQRLCSR